MMCVTRAPLTFGRAREPVRTAAAVRSVTRTPPAPPPTPRDDEEEEEEEEERDDEEDEDRSGYQYPSPAALERAYGHSTRRAREGEEVYEDEGVEEVVVEDSASFIGDEVEDMEDMEDMEDGRSLYLVRSSVDLRPAGLFSARKRRASRFHSGDTDSNDGDDVVVGDEDGAVEDAEEVGEAEGDVVVEEEALPEWTPGHWLRIYCNCAADAEADPASGAPVPVIALLCVVDVIASANAAGVVVVTRLFGMEATPVTTLGNVCLVTSAPGDVDLRAKMQDGGSEEVERTDFNNRHTPPALREATVPGPALAEPAVLLLVVYASLDGSTEGSNTEGWGRRTDESTACARAPVRRNLLS